MATLCSGASALLGARNDDGSWPFVGKRIAGFPTSEKIDFGVAEGAPWLLESRLTDAGARLYREVGPLLEGIDDAAGTISGSSAVVRGRPKIRHK